MGIRGSEESDLAMSDIVYSELLRLRIACDLLDPSVCVTAKALNAGIE